jgi:hypothetical protein
MTLAGPYLAGCLLLVVAGVAKARRPDDTARALAQLFGVRLASMGPIVRVGAVLEALVGLAGLSYPRSVVAASLVGASYLAFTGVVAVALRQGGPLATCGCFGKADTPPTLLHLVLTAGIAVSAGWMALAPVPAGAGSLRAASLWDAVGHQPGHGIPLLLTAGGLAFVAWLAMTLLAGVRGAR